MPTSLCPSISRRTVAKGALWGVPTVLVAASAPALAVSASKAKAYQTSASLGLGQGGSSGNKRTYVSFSGTARYWATSAEITAADEANIQLRIDSTSTFIDLSKVFNTVTDGVVQNTFNGNSPTLSTLTAGQTILDSKDKQWKVLSVSSSSIVIEYGPFLEGMGYDTTSPNLYFYAQKGTISAGSLTVTSLIDGIEVPFSSNTDASLALTAQGTLVGPKNDMKI